MIKKAKIASDIVHIPTGMYAIPHVTKNTIWTSAESLSSADEGVKTV